MPGVGLVSIGGQQNPAMIVSVNPLQLAALGLTLEDVRTSLSNLTVDDPKGVLEGGQESYALSANDQLAETSNFNNAIIAYRNGAPIRVGDIGTASIGPANNQLAGWYDTHKAIIVAIQRLPGANVIATVDQIKRELPQLEASLPPGIKVSIVSDRTTTIRASVDDVRVHAHPHHRSRGDEHPCVLAQPLGDHHSGRRGAAFDHRHLHRHGCIRLLAR